MTSISPVQPRAAAAPLQHHATAHTAPLAVPAISEPKTPVVAASALRQAAAGAATFAGPDPDALEHSSHAAGPAVVEPQVPRSPLQPGAGRLPEDLLNSAVDRALTADPAARLTIDDTSNTATFLSGSFEVDVKPGVGKRPADLVAREFLRHHGTLFGLTNEMDSSLRLLGVDKDELGFRHYRYQQVHGDLPVFGQQVVVHAQGNVVTSVGGRLTPMVGVTTEPKLAGQELTDKVLASFAATTGTERSLGKVLSTPKLGIYTTQEGAPRLAYEVELSNGRADGRWIYYLDADNGDVLDHWALVHSALARETYDAGSRSTRPGKIARKEGDGPVADEVVNKAHDNAGAVYNYFKSNYDRDSIDGRGMKLVSTVHFGTKYNNAFWDGSQMTYGDGDGVRFTSLGNALDVVGHEMMHGVTERTAGLRYQRQSGALNESWSDVFGNLIEKWEAGRKGEPDRDPTWLVGEDIFTPGVDGDGLRSMSAPGTAYDKDPQPAHMRDYKDTSSDNGGVHINSGIPNKAAYEVAQTIGTDKLADIWYRAVTNYLTPTSQFTDAANVTVQSASDLFGKDSAEVKAVQAAWTSVGLKPTSAPKSGS